MIKKSIALQFLALMVIFASCSGLRPDVSSGGFSFSFSGYFSESHKGDAQLVSYSEAGFNRFVESFDPDLAYTYQGFTFSYDKKDNDDEVTEKAELQFLYFGQSPIDVGSYSVNTTIEVNEGVSPQFITQFKVERGDTLEIYGNSESTQPEAFRISNVTDEEISGVLTVSYGYKQVFDLQEYNDSLAIGGSLPKELDVVYFEDNQLVVDGKFVASVE